VSIVDKRQELFHNVVRLRRAGREHPDDRDIAAVRGALERDLGETLSIRLAASLLGVSHTALRRWITAGDVPTVYDRSGKRGLPTPAVLDLYEAVESERERGRRRSHFIEPTITEDRERARRLRPAELVGADLPAAGHDRAERRALVYHRALGRRLKRAMIDDARHRLWQWREDGRIDPRYADRWEELLTRPVAEVRRAIGDDSQEGRDLRQNSPFAGMLSEPERRRILEDVR
jgi:hypothetical protein